MQPTIKRPQFGPSSFNLPATLAKKILVFDTDQIIFSPGDPASSVFYIRKGAVKLSVLSPQGKEAIIAILSEGQFVGEICVGGEAMDVRRAKGPSFVSACSAVRHGSDGKGNDPLSSPAPLCGDLVVRQYEVAVLRFQFCDESSLGGYHI